MHGEYHEGPMQAITMLRRLKSSSNYTLTRATSILPHVPRKTALEAAKIYMLVTVVFYCGAVVSLGGDKRVYGGKGTPVIPFRMLERQLI